MMRRFAERGRVLYVNSIVMRRFNVGEGRMFWRRLVRKARSIGRGLVKVGQRFWVYSPCSLPVHHLATLRHINARTIFAQVRWVMRALEMGKPMVWVACPVACEVALRLPRWALAYQRTDRFEEYPGVERDQIAAYDRRLKAAADVTFYVNRKMMAEEAGQCRRAVFLDHGVDFERFASVEKVSEVPEELRGLRRPIVGYFGDIDEKIIDMELLEAVVRRLPECRFVFVGGSSVDTSRLGARPNVTMVPRRPYDAIPHYGKCFDVAIMPFLRNDWIECCNPIKLKEYLALGKPVVSTPFSELEHYNGQVYCASTAEGWEIAIRQALREDSPERIKSRRDRVRSFSWESRAEMALTALGLR